MTTRKPIGIYEAFATSRSDAEDGKWFKLRPGTEIKLRKLNSKVSRDLRRKLEEEYDGMQDAEGNFPDEINEKLLIEQLAHAIVVDWKGFIDRNGEELPCTVENVRLLMADPDLSDLRDRITLMSMKIENFRAAKDAETVKN